MNKLGKLFEGITSIFHRTSAPRPNIKKSIRDLNTAIEALHHEKNPAEILNAIRFIRTRTIASNDNTADGRKETFRAADELLKALAATSIQSDIAGDIEEIGIKSSLVEALGAIRIGKAGSNDSLNNRIIPALCVLVVTDSHCRSDITAKQMAVSGMKCTGTENTEEAEIILHSLQTVYDKCNVGGPLQDPVMKVLAEKVESTRASYQGYTPKPAPDRTQSPDLTLF